MPVRRGPPLNYWSGRAPLRVPLSRVPEAVSFGLRPVAPGTPRRPFPGGRDARPVEPHHGRWSPPPLCVLPGLRVAALARGTGHVGDGDGQGGLPGRAGRPVGRNPHLDDPQGVRRGDPIGCSPISRRAGRVMTAHPIAPSFPIRFTCSSTNQAFRAVRHTACSRHEADSSCPQIPGIVAPNLTTFAKAKHQTNTTVTYERRLQVEQTRNLP